MTITLLQGDCRDTLPTLPEQSVQCVVTSPPYWGLRKYTDDEREIGNEPTPAAYVAALVEVFDLVHRVLRDDGTLWINLGDAYANDTKWGGRTSGKHAAGLQGTQYIGRNRSQTGLPSKSLIGLPWRVAFALQDAGWVLRNEIIWHKPAAMPENVGDRFSRDHEHLFFFSKYPHYYFDQIAVAIPLPRPSRFAGNRAKQVAITGGALSGGTSEHKNELTSRNERTVWSIPPEPLKGEHYAAFPQGLVEPCILAGSMPGDTVLDPFMGSGTVARVAEKYGRNAIGIDLGYQDLQEKRTNGVQVHMEALL